MKIVDYQALSEHLNSDLATMENLNFMLFFANQQYRKAVAQNLDGKVIKYLESKNDDYIDERNDIFNQIYHDYLIDKTRNYNKLIDCKRLLWKAFKREYPNCELSFEDIFKGTQATYPEAKQQISSGIGKNLGEDSLSSCFGNYCMAFIESEQLNTFNELLNDIYNQISEQGVKPFIPVSLSPNNALVPKWIIKKIDEVAEQAHADLRMQTFNLKFEINHLAKLEKKKNNDSEIENKSKQIEASLNKGEEESAILDNIFDAISNVSMRLEASETRPKVRQRPISMLEKLKEFFIDIPKDIKNLEAVNPDIIISKTEVENIICQTICCDALIMEGLLLGHVAGVETVIGLEDYNLSKHVVNVIKNEEQNIKVKLENLVKQQPTSLVEVERLKLYLKAVSSLKIQTPLGKLTYESGSLIDENGKTYSLETLNNYELVNGKVSIVKADTVTNIENPENKVLKK